ncbi:MAG: ATP-citrate (pro-S-)-lyase, subunit 2 [Candidatus Syntrophoarchaeum sp. GoM_oil]|nr:MAG: ATP-citrate (pro-S-)-lyase, subunit 2 [Candidatus Syntrophoarchaeum sp. GoM_oil]
MADYELFTKDTKSIIYGLQTNAIQRMLDFDYACRREDPSVVAVVNPGRRGLHKAFFGTGEILIPIYPNLPDATTYHPDADVLVNFASFRSAYPTTMEALDIDSIRTIAIIAEGVSERRAREIIAKAKEKGKMIIGPATVGGIKAGAFKIGNTAGTIENILESKLHRPGSVGFVSKSGGMSNEMYNIIARNTDGLVEGIAIGGDRFPGSTLIEHVLRFEENPDVKIIAALGEVGGMDEYQIVDALNEGKITKPIVIWVTGTCSKVLPGEVQFGHAGAMAGSDLETADVKNKVLREAGGIVPTSFDDYGEKLSEIYEKLKIEGTITERGEVAPPNIPLDFKTAVSEGLVRKSTNFICTISDDRGEEATYGRVPISEFVEGGNGIGDVISMLWFKKRLPPYATKFIEMVLMTVADHGPAVSGAHNTIVAARAGKDLVSSLVSGVLTIGPRFGGAINDAAMYFKDAHDRGLSPEAFVREMKQKDINISGIGHRIKSVQNPDKRVKTLIKYAKESFPSTEYLDYALGVEAVTTAKKNNLILNVDGCIGILFVDLMKSSGAFTDEEIQEVIDLGYLNGLFVLGRSIGLIGHAFDQYRLKERLYRHPWEDILYIMEEE